MCLIEKLIVYEVRCNGINLAKCFCVLIALYNGVSVVELLKNCYNVSNTFI